MSTSNGDVTPLAHQQVPMENVVAIMQRDFPNEFRLCLQGAYIEMLEARVRELSAAADPVMLPQNAARMPPP